MGLLNKHNREPNSNNALTVIAEGASIEGQLKLTSNIHIDGQVKGSIETECTVIISAKGSVDGSIKSERVIINGRFLGNVYTKSLEILENGYIEGDVSASELIIQKGGIFLGSSMNTSSLNVKTTEVVALDTVGKVSTVREKVEAKKIEKYA